MQKALTTASLLLFALGLSSSGMTQQFNRDSKNALTEVAVRLPATESLWQDPIDLESRDLFFGPGGQTHVPKGTFVMTSVSGSPEKVLSDGNGRSWMITTGSGAKAEVAASRIAWAVGYQVDQDYFMPQVTVPGGGGGTFNNVRFKLRSNDVTKIGDWKWSSNPFLGTRELEGLKVLMALLTNWNLANDNNIILRPTHSEDRIFYVSDLRSSLGKSGKNSFTRSQGNPQDYANQTFIDGVSAGQITFHLKGDYSELVRGIGVENARWIGNLLGRLSDKQLSDAFRAGGFSDVEVTVYVTAMRNRIKRLTQL